MIIVLVFLILMVCIEECAEYFYRKKYRNNLGDVKKFVEGIPGGLDIVNIGSGPGLYAIDYSECSKNGFNFSTAPQNFKYGFRILQKYCKKIQKNAIIIIIMCPLSFGNNKNYNREDYSDKYYAFLPAKSIDNYSLKRAFRLSHPLLNKIFNRAKSILHLSRKAQKSDFQNNDVRNNKTYDENELGIIRCWKEEFDLFDLKDAEQSKQHEKSFMEKIKILQDGIDYCLKKSWRPIFVIPPIPPKTRAYISNDFLKAFVFDNMEKVINNNPSIQLLNYYCDDDFTQEKFANDIFVNEAGKKLFSQKLFSKIEEVINENEEIHMVYHQ